VAGSVLGRWGGRHGIASRHFRHGLCMRPEISDLIVDFDPESLQRRPVRQANVVGRFLAAGNHTAARIVRGIPSVGGVLDNDAVDAILVQAHTELQRLHEEFQHGRRVLRLLVPLVRAARAAGHRGPLRVVDLGCGLGFVVRWLAARGGLPADVELVGCDYNRALVERAQQLADAESLRCRFVVGNALTLAEPAHIILSTGVIHHFQGDALVDFFAAQARAGLWAAVHYDITPNWAAPLGAWLFHRARMRMPLARHDGLLSALRAHDDAVLLAAARMGGPGRSALLFECPSPWMPMLRVLRPVLSLRADVEGPLRAELGGLASELRVGGGR